ncbi:MerR family transcriptional regulator [Limibacillus halophilus]|uniref:DNA-binding transcriptional MerR regulator n=1 Tax=Limibacillus halophilus TaxID=1579333 RepID=A0A839SSA0_9PROT|nr:MerR family transcriptional regulator [Limibacillus halophilus]MBB3065747.1 DNA-binding transcriptional MerR regulator [Limibacillus halophilus]
MATARGNGKSAAAFRTISEVADELDVPQHVLRFWESKFTQVKPLKRGGGRRYYRPEDVELLRQIRELLYDDGYTIKGVQKLLREGQLTRAGAASAAEQSSEPLARSGHPKAKEAAKAGREAAASALPREKRKELEGIMRDLLNLRAELKRLPRN